MSHGQTNLEKIETEKEQSRVGEGRRQGTREGGREGWMERKRGGKHGKICKF